MRFPYFISLFIFFFLFCLPCLSQTSSSVQDPSFDLVAVKGASPSQMFEAGIKELGGLESFIKKGQTVLVKPNIGWDKNPLEAANTNPTLVGKIIEMAYKAGASKVYVLDHPVDEVRACFKNSGIEKAAVDNNGIIDYADKPKNYFPVKIKNASILKEVFVHKLYRSANVIINVPILKSHGATLLTGAIKNLMGVVWDRGFYHRSGLHECIAEFPLYRKPDLNVMDAYQVMLKHGPRGITQSDLSEKKMLLISRDILAIDVAGAKILGLDPNKIEYLNIAAKLGYGKFDLAQSKIKKISL